MDYLNKISPIWIIDCKNIHKNNDFRKAASITYSERPAETNPHPLDNKGQLQILNLLDRLNEYFKEASESYFNSIQKTPEIEEKLQEIRQKFDQIHHWIRQLKALFEKDNPSS